MSLASPVNLRIFFWMDGREHDTLRVKSAVIRLVKRALDEGQFTMPDEAREVIFPEGVPIGSFDAPASASALETGDDSEYVQEPIQPKLGPEPLITKAEGALRSEDEQLREQARAAPSPEGDENLLRA